MGDADLLQVLRRVPRDWLLLWSELIRAERCELSGRCDSSLYNAGSSIAALEQRSGAADAASTAEPRAGDRVCGSAADRAGALARERACAELTQVERCERARESDSMFRGH